MKQFIFEAFNQHRMARGADAARVLVVDDEGEDWALWMSEADIRGNVVEFGPHYGLLVAASHYHMNIEKLVALHRSKGKNKAFLQPMEPVRDQCGFWTHPDYPPADDTGLAETKFGLWLRAVGFESSTETPPYLANCESDISDWQPTAPEGDGWFVGSIHETEGEPNAVCVWLRKLEVV